MSHGQAGKAILVGTCECLGLRVPHVLPVRTWGVLSSRTGCGAILYGFICDEGLNWRNYCIFAGRMAYYLYEYDEVLWKRISY